jgi:hypothetical protein
MLKLLIGQVENLKGKWTIKMRGGPPKRQVAVIF